MRWRLSRNHSRRSFEIASTQSFNSHHSMRARSHASSTNLSWNSKPSLARIMSRLNWDDAARNWIAERGYDPKMGARPMARIIQEYIKRPLAEELLFGSLADGGHVRIGVGADGNLELKAGTGAQGTRTPAERIADESVQSPEKTEKTDVIARSAATKQPLDELARPLGGCRRRASPASQ